MADYSEIDVQTTADGIVVVCHDLNLKRVAGVDRRLGTMTYDQVSRLDVGSHLAPGLPGSGYPPWKKCWKPAKAV